MATPVVAALVGEPPTIPTLPPAAPTGPGPRLEIAGTPVPPEAPFVLFGALLFGLAAAAGQLMRSDPRLVRRLAESFDGMRRAAGGRSTIAAHGMMAGGPEAAGKSSHDWMGGDSPTAEPASSGTSRHDLSAALDGTPGSGGHPAVKATAPGGSIGSSGAGAFSPISPDAAHGAASSLGSAHPPLSDYGAGSLPSADVAAGQPAPGGDLVGSSGGSAGGDLTSGANGAGSGGQAGGSGGTDALAQGDAGSGGKLTAAPGESSWASATSGGPPGGVDGTLASGGPPDPGLGDIRTADGAVRSAGPGVPADLTASASADVGNLPAPGDLAPSEAGTGAPPLTTPGGGPNALLGSPWLAAGALGRGASASPLRTVRCPRCERTLSYGARFCGFCGEPLDRTLG